MIKPETIINTLQEAAICRAIPGGVLVATDCLYPSDSVVQIEVTGDRNYTVSDRGEALDVLANHGVAVKNPHRALEQFARVYGANISNSGAIYLNDIDLNHLPFAIVIIANASKDAATILLERHRFTLYSQFKSEVREVLSKRFRNQLSENFEVVGSSNKTHTFDYAVMRKDTGILVMNSAVDDGNSINSAVVSSLDVRLREDKSVIPRIIYDDREDWRSESLILLQEGAPVIQYSKLSKSVEKFVSGDNQHLTS